MKKILLLLLLVPSVVWAQSRPIVPGDVGIQAPFGAVGNVLVAGPGTSQIQDSSRLGANGGISQGGGGVPAYNNCYWNDIDSCTTTNVRIRERLFIGNSVLALDTRSNCCTNVWANTAVRDSWQVRDAQVAILTDRGGIAVTGMAQSSQGDAFGTGGTKPAPIGVSSFVLNDTTLTNQAAWGMYSEITHGPTASGGFSYGIEIDTRNTTAVNATGNPYSIGQGAIDLWIAAGAGSGAINPSNAAMVILPNGQTFNEGIIIKDGGLTKDGLGNSQAILLGALAAIQWYTNSSTVGGILTSNAPATITHGGADAPAPVAQFLSVQSVAAGTTDTAGVDFTIRGSAGTGAGAGGNVNIATASAGTTGSAQNGFQQRLCVTGPGKVIISATCSERPVANGVVLPVFEITTASSLGSGSAAIINYQNSATAPAVLYLGLSKSNTLGTIVAVASGDQLGRLVGEGSDGGTYQDSSTIRFEAEGTVSAGIVPGRIVFQTATSAGTLTEAFRVTSAQQIQYLGAVVGTPVASLCLDASNNIIKKTTTGPCI
jgi:hypothetical protein